MKKDGLIDKRVALAIAKISVGRALKMKDDALRVNDMLTATYYDGVIEGIANLSVICDLVENKQQLFDWDISPNALDSAKQSLQ